MGPLYDRSRDEKDACGIGFVADAAGRPARALVDAGLEALCRMEHRGAVAADALSGDGAGILLPIPRAIVPQGGLAMVFSRYASHRALVETACASEGIEVASWRQVPIDEAALGELARTTLPVIEQAVLTAEVGESEENERRAFRARRRIETAVRSEKADLYLASMSFRTVTYKALCAAGQLASFYPDLCDAELEAWFAVFHLRYSTNTAPTWERAQPFRMLGHNGEINTIRGNVALMRGREGRLGAAGHLCPEDLLRPVVDEAGSDSQVLDEALELLVRGGRPLQHASRMLVPPAWEQQELPERTRGFFDYHSCLMEPWDGPAGLVFADGTTVGAALDRNGLRPMRIATCEDGFVACASEAGAVPLGGRGLVRRFRLGPGQSFSVSAQKGVQEDHAILSELAAGRDYARIVSARAAPCSQGDPLAAPGADLRPRQVAAGYTKEELTVVMRPMATQGQEPTSSMGDDTAEPPLAQVARPVWSFLKQRFAQVTNPPIDHLRERHVMSLTTRLGPRAPLLSELEEAAALRLYRSFALFPSALDELAAAGGRVLDASFDIGDGPEGLEQACRRLAEEAAAAGAPWVICSHHNVSDERAPVPSALAGGAVHHRLLEAGLRTLVSVVVSADDAFDSHHAACLLTNGADLVCPRLALETIADLASRGRLGGGVSAPEAQCNLMQALEDGVLKVMSKMGISTLDSYRGAQIIEAVGLAEDVMALCFSGIRSPLNGLDFVELGADVLLRHDAGFSRGSQLPNFGLIKYRKGGDYHATNPEVVDALHRAVGLTEDSEMQSAHELRRASRAGDPDSYERFAKLVNERPPSEPRDLLEPAPAGASVPVEEVEPASTIATRFSTGAMSHGALSSEAHETLALALDLIGGKANTGEGGEAPERYLDARNSAIKQVASGRFGVTPAYLSSAGELQIKMAQGSKPGEGGQLPGLKVSVEIARLRHTVPGVALISPPPHHDIYSIEDLAQLIFDLKQANPEAAVSVKLVSSEGVGVIAAGVVKGLADVVHISGADGGTGASPLSSIKNAGLPWEIGLAETQQALVANDLRGRARIRIDGGIKTGRDVVLAALLGADEVSFGTAALLAEGCILVRTCHRNTCPVGIATQDPKLRAKFRGTPEMVARYLMFVAEEARHLLATLGLRSFAEGVGRTDLLRPKAITGARARSLDLSPLLEHPGEGPRRFVTGVPEQRPRAALGDRLTSDALRGLERGERVELAYDISTSDRSVGARLGCALASATSSSLVTARFRGSAGQSFGSFLSEGIELILEGEANDYLGKGMAGGRIVIRPPQGDAGHPCLAGNTALYGATGGQLYIAGHAGERFAVRNSGAVAVVEGTGDHACEYMTAGAVVVLGPTGINFGAGMSGGEAYVYDPDELIGGRLNAQLVAAYEPSAAQLTSLQRVLIRHLDHTGSPLAGDILGAWRETGAVFRRIAPVAEVARLEALFEGPAAA
ncbi:MAG TPA: glutamate synthase large subunit [Actinomycetota bacterium]|nr:glutamate synthase large subunit [Actinomycetota bacterium]